MKRTKNMLKVTISSVEDSPVYRSPEFTGLEIESAHIVERGTEEGNPTVDFVLVDENGKKYVAMTTGNLMESLSAAVIGTRLRTENDG